MTEETEVKKFILIGGNAPEMNEAIIKAIKENTNTENPIVIHELSPEEMNMVVQSRAMNIGEEASLNYLEDEKNLQRVQDWIKTIINNHFEIKINKVKNHSEKEQLKLTLRTVLDGGLNVAFTKKELKEASTLPWKDFEELFNTLSLFKVLEELEGGKFQLLLDNEAMVRNQIRELKELVKLSVAKTINLVKMKGATEEEIKNLNSTKKTLTTALNKIS